MNKYFPLALIATLFLSVFASALPDDSQQPISIKANHSKLDNINGILTYEGAVLFIQGSISIESEYLEVRLVDGAITFAEAKGTPAKFSQMTDIDGTTMVATGHLLKYEVATQLLHIATNAVVIEGDNRMSGGIIDYQLDTGNADISGDPNVGDGRMELIFVPAAKDTK
jgi:lipopolysaccharide export system protein LptA